MCAVPSTRSVAGHARMAGRSLDPHVPSLLGGPPRIVSEGLACGDDFPDGGPVGVGVFADLHRGILTETHNQRLGLRTVNPLPLSAG